MLCYIEWFYSKCAWFCRRLYFLRKPARICSYLVQLDCWESKRVLSFKLRSQRFGSVHRRSRGTSRVVLAPKRSRGVRPTVLVGTVVNCILEDGGARHLSLGPECKHRLSLTERQPRLLQHNSRSCYHRGRRFSDGPHAAHHQRNRRRYCRGIPSRCTHVFPATTSVLVKLEDAAEIEFHRARPAHG